MSNLKNGKFFAKVFLTTLIIAGAVFYPSIGAGYAQAQTVTTAELQAQIQELLAKIAALQAQLGGGATVSNCPALTQPLTIGSQGPQVVALQNYLTTTGHFTFSGGSTGYFGPITQSAVAAWQSANGVAPAVGYWGPISLARYNAVCMPTPAPAPTPTPDPDKDDDKPAKGTEGSITVTRGSANSSVLDLGDTEDVYSIKVEAESSDMTINRMDFMFNKRPWLYINELELTLGGEKIASIKMAQSKVTEVGSEWRVRFNNLDIEIEEGDKEEIVLWATTPQSLAGTRANDTVSVYMPDDGIRAVDTKGLIHYEPSGDLSPRSFSFDENFGLGEIEVRTNSDSPEQGIMVVSTTKKTENVEVLRFDVEADDGSVTVKEMYVTATTSTLDKPDDVASQLCLYKGSTQLDCGTFAKASSAISNRGVSTGVVSGDYYVLFDDLDLEIDEDDKETFVVKASFAKISGATYSSGETVAFALQQVAGINEDFENTADSSLGIGSDEVFTLLTEGVFVEGTGTTSASVSQIGNTAEERGTFTIRFDVTAIEEDAWIHQNVGDTATSGVEFDVVGDSYTGTTTSSLTCSGCTTSGSTFFKVSRGTTKTFALTVVLNPASDGIYGIELDSIYFGSGASITPAHVKVSVPDTSKFETDQKFIAG